MKRNKPGSLLPLGGAAVPEGKLVQLREEVVGDVLKVVVLCAQDELDTLGRSVCAHSGSGRERVRRTSRVRWVGSRVSVLPTVSGRLPPIVLGLVKAPLLLLAVVPVSPVAVPSLALPPQRDVDADVHGPVAWGTNWNAAVSDG